MPGQLKVLVVGQTPPPHGGQAVMLDRLVRASFERIKIYHVRMSFSATRSSIGRFEARKVIHLLEVIVRALFVRFRHGIRTLYYPPAGPSRNAVLRDIVLLLVLRRFFATTVYSFHAAGVSEFLEHQPGWLRFLAARAYARPDGAVQLSCLLPRDGEYVRAQITRIIPNGIEDVAPALLRGDRRAERSEVRVLYAGFVNETKGVMELLEAVRRVGAKHKNLVLTLMGEFGSADFEQRAKAFCEQHELCEVVTFAGVCVGAAKWEQFAAADIFCLPSYFESEALPVAVIEAMMFELPVVATRWRGIPDLVEDGVTGLLVPVRDPTALAAALDVLLSNGAMRRTMGVRARRIFLDRFTLERHLRATEEFLLDTAGA